MRRGNLFVISGPSGVGKGTIIREAIDRLDDGWLSVSATSRSPRPHEADGIDYFFLTPEAFEELIANDGLLEWASYNGNFYGTPKAAVEQAIAEGKQVILEIEVQGALQVRDIFPDAHLVFVEPPSMEVLEERLRGRATESEEAISGRLATAEVELAQKMRYDKRLVNDDLETAIGALIDYIDMHAEAGEE